MYVFFHILQAHTAAMNYERLSNPSAFETSISGGTTENTSSTEGRQERQEEPPCMNSGTSQIKPSGDDCLIKQAREHATEILFCHIRMQAANNF